MIAVALWVGLAVARDPCGGLSIQEDAPQFGGASWSHARPGFRLEQREGEPFIVLAVAEPGLATSDVKAGRALSLKLDDDTVIELFTAELSRPEGGVTVVAGRTVAVSTTRYLLRAALTDEALHALARSPVETLRFVAFTEEQKVEASSWWAGRLQRGAACLANTRSTVR